MTTRSRIQNVSPVNSELKGRLRNLKSTATNSTPEKKLIYRLS